jgi:hypothetical protein
LHDKHASSALIRKARQGLSDNTTFKSDPLCYIRGTFFARLQVGGNLIRKSLQTDLLCIAKLRLADLDQPERGFMKTRKTIRPAGVVNSVSKFFFGAGSNLVILCRPKSEGNQTKNERPEVVRFPAF